MFGNLSEGEMSSSHNFSGILLVLLFETGSPIAQTDLTLAL